MPGDKYHNYKFINIKLILEYDEYVIIYFNGLGWTFYACFYS